VCQKSCDNNHTLDAKVSREYLAAFRHLARYGVSMCPWIDKHSGKLCGRSARRAARLGLKALLRLSASGSQPRRPRPQRGRELRKLGPRPRKLRSVIVDNLVSFSFFDALYALPLRPDFWLAFTDKTRTIVRLLHASSQASQWKMRVLCSHKEAVILAVGAWGSLG
jgi:hypothetical protein